MTLFDLRQVNDWKLVEVSLHRVFSEQRARDIAGVDELFRVSPVSVRRELERIDPASLIGQVAVDKMFGDGDFAAYLRKLFVFAGLPNWLDIQGAWTLTLYPGTNGGRYFTINVGTHEVAFSTLPFEAGGPSQHCLVVDALILDFVEVVDWVEQRGGGLEQSPYASALPRAVSVWFDAPFCDAELFFQLDGVRRALIAYWSEALLLLYQKGSSSMFARFHNHNAVSTLCRNLTGSGLYRLAETS